MLGKAAMGLKLLSPFARALTGPDGEVTIPATHLNPADVARLADVGAKLASLGVGLPTDRASVQDGGADESAELLATVKDDLRERLNAIRERQRQANGAVGEGLGRLNGGEPDAV